MQSQLEFKEIKSNKSKWSNVFVAGYKFTHQRATDDTHYYTCATYKVSKCGCRLIKDKNGSFTIKGAHSHAPNPEKREVNEVLSTIKEKAKTEKNSKARVLISEACASIGSQIAANLPTMSQMSRTVSRVRNRDLNPSLSQISNRLILTPELTTTAKGDSFLLFDNEDDEDRVIMLGTMENVRILAHCANIFCDGTFDVIPKGFGQLYTIHGEYLFLLFPYTFEKLFCRIYL